MREGVKQTYKGRIRFLSWKELLNNATKMSQLLLQIRKMKDRGNLSKLTNLANYRTGPIIQVRTNELDLSFHPPELHFLHL